MLRIPLLLPWRILVPIPLMPQSCTAHKSTHNVQTIPGLNNANETKKYKTTGLTTLVLFACVSSKVKKGKVCIRANVAHQAGAYPGFCSKKRLGVFLLPPGWDASPSQGYPPACGDPVFRGPTTFPLRPSHVFPIG